MSFRLNFRRLLDVRALLIEFYVRNVDGAIILQTTLIVRSEIDRCYCNKVDTEWLSSMCMFKLSAA